jgi:hypothetical protein
LRATVTSEGVLTTGAGIEIAKTGTGAYTLKYAEFKDAPAINLTTSTSNTFFQIISVGVKEATITSKSVTTTPVATNAGFHVQIIGKVTG